jgi:hypothetical protein
MKRSFTPLLLAAVALFAAPTAFAQDDPFPDAEAPPEGGDPEPEPVDPVAPDGDGDADPLAPGPEEDFDFAPDDAPEETPAVPEEEIDDLPAAKKKAGIRWGRTSAYGLSGFGQMLTTDALPDALGIRASLDIETQHAVVHNRPGFNPHANAQIYSLGVGVALMEMIEVSLRVPFIDWDLTFHDGGSPSSGIDDDEGFGNPDIAVKFLFPLDMDMIKLGAFLRLQPGIGTYEVFTPRRFPMEEGNVGEYEYGVIAALDFDIASIYTNLALRDFEDDTNFRPSYSYRWRIGATVDPMDMLSVGLYFDFEEFEGTTRMNGFLGLNADVFLMDMIVVSLGFEYLMLDDGVDDLTSIGGAQDIVDYYSFNFGVSVLF